VGGFSLTSSLAAFSSASSLSVFSGVAVVVSAAFTGVKGDSGTAPSAFTPA